MNKMTLAKKFQTPSQEKTPPPKNTSLSFQTPLSNVLVVLVKGSNA